MPFADTDGIVLNYRIDGGDGLPLLVLSNGLGLDLSMWDPQIPALSREFRVLRYDTRGHGASSTGSAPISIDHLGRDVLALIDRAGATRMHFCGLSMGGMIGMWLGIHAPQRLNGLVLAHTAAHIGPLTMWNARIDTVNSKGMKAISDAAMTRWFTTGFIVRQPGIVGAMKASMERCSAPGYTLCCAAVRDADFRNAVARIKTRTLIINGKQDIATTPADGRYLAQQIAGSEAVELDSAHLSNIEKSAEFTESLCAFLRKEGASTPTQQSIGLR